VKARLETNAAHFYYSDRMALTTVFDGNVLEIQHAVSNALELAIWRFRRAIVEKQNGAVACQKILFEREDLSPEPQRITRQHSHLGKRVEHDANRIHSFNFVEDHPRRLIELDFGRVKYRVARIVGQAIA
jgi:hypothetical protein